MAFWLLFSGGFHASRAQSAAGLFEDHADVGVVLHPGSAEYNAAERTYTVAGSGENMWFAADALHFAWKKVSGDVTLTANISFIGTGGNAHRKAVLMIRQSLDADSAYADAAVHILALGKYPQRFIPALDVLRRNMKHRSVVQGLYREDAEEYPVTAVREAIVNALAHRDLSNGSRGTPVQVQMFSDHLVVHNPGGLYGPVTVDSLGREGICATRNNMLLKLLEDVAPAGERQAVCENRGSGVGAMVASLRQARLPDRVTLSRAEISQALGLDISIRKWLATMRDEGIIVATAQKIRSKNVRYELARR
jgi:hypothetical protein